MDGAAPDVKAAVAAGEMGIEEAREVIAKSEGDIEKQKEAVKKKRDGGRRHTPSASMSWVISAWWRNTPKAAKPRSPSRASLRRSTRLGGASAARNGGVDTSRSTTSVQASAAQGEYRGHLSGENSVSE